MGIFSQFIKSWRKSSKLAKLESRIASPGRMREYNTADFVKSYFENAKDSDRALEEFLDLCVSDEGVKKVMEVENLSRADLKEIYCMLLRVGLGQWIKGHYAALSTIAYLEPLLYVVRSKKQQKGELLEIAGNLLAYWEDEIPPGALLNKVK